jgi:Icc-related predicted phosphoesterase
MREDELERYTGDPEAVEGLFTELMHATLIRWMDHARQKLAGTGVRILTAPGNDDPFSIDDVIREHGGGHFQLLEGEVYEVAPGHEMLNTGYTNVTPWNTHREYSEEQIAAHLKEMTARLERPEQSIFNIHVPPYNSALDTAPALGDDLAVRTSMGAQVTAPVGSTAVREALEEHQPLLSLHGHIHESGGMTRIGRTVAINAGSEYGEGVLRGLLVTVGGGKVLRHQATTG